MKKEEKKLLDNLYQVFDDERTSFRRLLKHVLQFELVALLIAMGVQFTIDASIGAILVILTVIILIVTAAFYVAGD